MRPAVILLLCLWCAAAHAQPPSISAEHLHLLRSLMSASTHTYAPLAKTTQVAERVIAQSTYNNYSVTNNSTQATFQLDSFTYKYANGRGSHFDYYKLIYPEQFSDGPIIDYMAPIDPRSLTSEAQPLDEMADTITHCFKEQLWLNYDQHNKITALTDSVYGVSSGDTKFLWFHYNTDATLSDVWTLVWNQRPGNANGAFKYIDHQDFYAYQNGQRVLDSLVYPSVSQFNTSSVYGYDVNGNATTIVTYDYNHTIKSKYLNRYTPQNQLKTVNYYLADSTGFKLNSYDSFMYSGNYTMPAFWDHIVYGPNGGINEQAHQYHWSAAGLIDAVYTFVNYVPGTVFTIQYDTANYPTEVSGNYIDKQVLAFYFYYEPYVPISVPIVAPQSTIKVYPNPTVDAVNITGMQPSGSPITIKMCNAVGRTVMTKKVDNVSQASLSLSSLAPGIYLLTIADKSGIIYSQQINKR